MDERRTKLSDRLAQSRQELLATLDELAADELAQRPVTDGWSVQDVVAHLASAERGHQQVIVALLAGRDTHQPGFDLDAFNQAEVSARRSLPAAALLRELEASRTATLVLLETVASNDWERAGYHPGGFDTTVEGVFRVIAIHEKRHVKEIRAALSSVRGD